MTYNVQSALLQAPVDVEILPANIDASVGISSADADIVDEGVDGLPGPADDLSDYENEFADLFGPEEDPITSDKHDCPKACYVSGDCHVDEKD